MQRLDSMEYSHSNSRPSFLSMTAPRITPYTTFTPPLNTESSGRPSTLNCAVQSIIWEIHRAFQASNVRISSDLGRLETMLGCSVAKTTSTHQQLCVAQSEIRAHKKQLREVQNSIQAMQVQLSSMLALRETEHRLRLLEQSRKSNSIDALLARLSRHEKRLDECLGKRDHRGTR